MGTGGKLIPIDEGDQGKGSKEVELSEKSEALQKKEEEEIGKIIKDEKPSQGRLAKRVRLKNMRMDRNIFNKGKIH